MNKFHQIPTDTFLPISHDNSYLFNHYEKVANFLAFNLEKNYKNILAKPVQNGYTFDWFSIYDNLINIEEKSKAESEAELVKYWEFIELINNKINQLSASNDDNNKNWASLLNKVFNHKDNFIFSNGKDICVVWGWKFDNNKNYKPNIVVRPLESLVPKQKEDSENENNIGLPPIFNDKPIEKEDEQEAPFDEEIKERAEVFEEIPAEELLEINNPENSSFIEFLKWFASKYWWILIVLAALIIVVFLYKTIKYNAF